MSTQAVQEFYKASNRNLDLIKGMVKDIKNEGDFIRNAVAEGKRQGYEFSYGEADRFIKDMQGLVAKKKSGGELSDLELEMVAGGKFSLGGDDNVQQPDGTTVPNWQFQVTTFVNSFSSAMSSVGSWFSSW